MSEARKEAERRWPKGWDVEEGTWRDGAVNGFILGAEWADQGKPSPPNPLPESGGHRPQRLNAKLRASLIDFAKDRIQAVWNDVGETDAATLAENVVSAQEFAWLSAQVPIVTDERVEAGARALAGRRYGLRSADTDNPRDYRDARAVLEAALGGEK